MVDDEVLRSPVPAGLHLHGAHTQGPSVTTDAAHTAPSLPPACPQPGAGLTCTHPECLRKDILGRTSGCRQRVPHNSAAPSPMVATAACQHSAHTRAVLAVAAGPHPHTPLIAMCAQEGPPARPKEAAFWCLAFRPKPACQALRACMRGTPLGP